MSKKKQSTSQPQSQPMLKEKPEKVPVTFNGVTVMVYPDIRQDFKMFKLMVGVNRGDQTAELEAIEYMFGDQLPEIEVALQDERGVVLTDDVAKIFWGVLGELAKNSNGS